MTDTPISDAELVPNPSPVGTLPEPAGLPASALEIMTRSELDTQMLAARRYPRSLALFRQNVTAMIRQDIETAEACYYVLKRRKTEGGSATIEGPTIRLAEIVKSAWGNLHSGGRVLGIREGEIIGQGFAYDLQTNTSTRREVARRITRADGSRFSDDMVTVTGNAAVAIAERNAIFAVIPRSLIDPFWRMAKKVVAGSIKTLGEARKRALAECAELGATPARVCAVLGKAGPDDLTPEDLVDLRGILNSIHEGRITAADAFPGPPTPAASEPAQTRTEALTESLRSRRRPPPSPAPATDRGAEPPAAEEPAAGDPGPKPPTAS